MSDNNTPKEQQQIEVTTHPFQRELEKRLRNKNKRLLEIIALEALVKKN
jgi:hypothetical protein